MLNLPIKILRTIEIEAARATIEFDDIAERVAQWDAVARVTSRHLVLIVNAASEDAVAKRAVEITINADAGATYNHQTLTGENAVDDADRQDGINALFEYPGGTDYPFAIPGTTYANAFGGGTILIPHAFNTTNHKVALALGGAVEDYVSTVVGRWASVAAITSLILSPDTGNFVAGSTVSLGVIDERYLVEEIDLSGGAGQAIFDNIPQGEGNLCLIGYPRSDRAANAETIVLYINDDLVGANYQQQFTAGIAGATSAGNGNANLLVSVVTGDTATALVFGAIVMVISQYIKQNQPHILITAGFHESSGPRGNISLHSLRRDNIEPINKIRLQTNIGTEWVEGSLFSLYRVPKRIIERVIVPAGGQATITFANIPQNFEDLILHVYARSSRAAVNDAITFVLNGDAVAANYDAQNLSGTGAGVAASRDAASPYWVSVPGDTEGVGEFGGGSVLFPGYAKTDRHKHVIVHYGRDENDVYIISGRWENLNAITSIVLSLFTGPNFLAGTVVELEGILRREGLPPSEGMRV